MQTELRAGIRVLHSRGRDLLPEVRSVLSLDSVLFSAAGVLVQFDSRVDVVLSALFPIFVIIVVIRGVLEHDPIEHSLRVVFVVIIVIALVSEPSLDRVCLGRPENVVGLFLFIVVIIIAGFII